MEAIGSRSPSSRLNRRPGPCIDERIIFLVGGYCAERYAWQTKITLAARLDFERAIELLSTGDDMWRLERLMRRADGLIAARWGQVEIIAEA